MPHCFRLIALAQATNTLAGSREVEKGSGVGVAVTPGRGAMGIFGIGVSGAPVAEAVSAGLALGTGCCCVAGEQAASAASAIVAAMCFMPGSASRHRAR